MAGKRRTTRRRAILGCGGVVAGFLGLGCGAIGTAFTVAWRGHQHSNVGQLDFANPLNIPPIVDGTLGDDGIYGFDLALRTGTADILAGKQTPTWGVNGLFLAPTLRATRGQTVRATVRNGLPEATTIHWHGMHLPAMMDGGTHQMIEPGATWSPRWEVTQPAATLWYHPHPHGATAQHVYRGIAGLFILEDDASLAAGLPNTYGVDDVPLIVQDKLFDDDGSFLESPTGLTANFMGAAEAGLMGDTILVNGTYDPHLDVTTTLVRLRLLNGSNARSYNLGLTDERAFLLIATENGLLPEPVSLTRLPLAPGERAEIVVAFAPGDDVILRSYEPDLGTGFPNARWWGGDDVFDLIQFRAAETLDRSPPLPERIGVDDATAAIPLPADARTRTFEMTGHHAINDLEFDMTRVDAVVDAGTTELWEIDSDGLMHTFHIHGVSYRVVDIDGEPPPGHLTGLKDTVFVPAGSAIRLAIRFPDLVDPTHPYMYHCHLLRHEDNGMMGQYVVVEPGIEVSTPHTLPASSLHVGH